ncbi:hypothetical protein MKK75_12460, partial [Methylobacterium sp. J-030]|uniref:hypothetical protein n=1 Tax=Methylobacterium sp. J-030 TaxID=2836627 RepID=UPI001FBBCA11
ALFRWAFYAANWSRVVARVPADLPVLPDLLRRAGCKHDGRPHCRLNGADAQLWALTAHDALWIMPRPMHRPAQAERGIPIPAPLKRY